MKVILLKNIVKLGQAGEVKNVSDGYAMNFLLPRKLAEVATEQKMEKLRNKEIKKQRDKEGEKEESMKKLKKLTEIKEIILTRKASDGGKLFAGIGPNEIAAELKQQKKIEVGEKFIKLDKHIKEIGEHTIKIEFGGNLMAEIRVKVLADK